MFGAGLPVALQNKFRLEPSITVWLSLYEVILVGTERKEYNNVWLWYRFIITMKKFFMATLVLKDSGKYLWHIIMFFISTAAEGWGEKEVFPRQYETVKRTVKGGVEP